MEKSNHIKILFALGLVGFLLFLCLALSVRPTISDDSPTYIDCAEALAHFDPNDCNPSRTPGYPLYLLLSDTLLGGLGYQLSVVLQYLMVLGSAFLLFLLAQKLFRDVRVGYVVFFLSATYPLFLFYANNVLTEIPFVFLLTAGLYLGTSYADRKNPGFLLGASVLLGLAALVRPYAVYLLPLWALYLIILAWKNWKIMARDVLLAMALFALPLVPWLIKNDLQYGRPALQYLSGIALSTVVYHVDGLPLVDSPLYASEKMQIKDQDPDFESPYQVLASMNYDPAEYDEILMAVSIETILRHPLAYAKATAVNFAKLAFYSKYAYGDYLVVDQARNMRSGRASEIFFYVYRDLQYKFNYPVIVLTGLAFYGLWLAWRRTDRAGRLACGLIAAVTFFSLAITAASIIPNVRYRVVTDQFFMLFAAIALVWLWDKLKSRLQKGFN